MGVGEVPGELRGLEAVRLVWLHVVGVSEAAVDGVVQSGLWSGSPLRSAVEYLLEATPQRGSSLPSSPSFLQLHGWCCSQTGALPIPRL